MAPPEDVAPAAEAIGPLELAPATPDTAAPPPPGLPSGLELPQAPSSTEPTVEAIKARVAIE
jgi:hypothetical protein